MVGVGATLKCLLNCTQGGRLRLPVARVGHGDARGQEPHQPDADRQPAEEDQVGRGAQAPMDLRKYP